MTINSGLPEHFTPAEIAKHFGLSERKVREDARRYGFCRVVGSRLFLTREDLDALPESWRSPASTPGRSSPDSTYADLVRLRSKDTTAAALQHLDRASKSGRKPRNR